VQNQALFGNLHIMFAMGLAPEIKLMYVY